MIFIVLIGLIAVISCICLKGSNPFYVGVTYGGDNVADAKQLIDKVKDYTNLFVLLSGEMQDNITAINEVGDHAVDSGLNFMVYFGTDKALLSKNWLETYDGRWNASFLGYYYGDEMGGKMLDNERQFYDNKKQTTIMKFADGRISSRIDANTRVDYKPDGSIVTTLNNQSDPKGWSYTTYYPNGTVVYTTSMFSGEETIEYLTNAPYTYEELLNTRPLQNFNETAEIFVHEINFVINRFGPRANFTYLTSDYALYWFDYLGGYDAVLAQLGWNHTVEQDIGLVRGAANLQNKSGARLLRGSTHKSPIWLVVKKFMTKCAFHTSVVQSML
jgi:hypothetical protein